MARFTLHGPDGPKTFTLAGRPGWLLARLIEAGQTGLTAADFAPGLRVAGFVHRIRQAGVPVETRYERHEGRFPGNHARYRLAAEVKPIEGAQE